MMWKWLAVRELVGADVGKIVMEYLLCFFAGASIFLACDIMILLAIIVVLVILLLWKDKKEKERRPLIQILPPQYIESEEGPREYSAYALIGA
jgi:hypothetical protein